MASVSKGSVKANIKELDPPTDSHSQRSGGLSVLLVLIGIFVIFVAVLVKITLDSPSFGKSIGPLEPQTRLEYRDPKRSWSARNLIRKKVERIEWAPHIPFTEQLIQMREPVILTNTVVQKWRAFEEWNQVGYLEYQYNRSGTMKEVKMGVSGTMSDHNPDRPLMKFITGFQRNYAVADLEPKEFFQKIISDDPNETYYYAYLKVPVHIKAADIQPNEFLWVLEDDRKENEMYMWLGGAGIGPGIHYDMDHNIFVQVVGRKRFVLFPPWQARNLYVYPSVHPLDRKSQVDFDSPDLDRFPLYQNATGYEAILEPGDLLYVPPYWWHKVHSLSPSFSLSSLSSSGVFQAMKPLYEYKFKMDEFEDGSERAGATVGFITLLLKEMYATEYRTLLQDLVDTRWKPLRDMKDGNLGNSCAYEKRFDSSIFASDVAFAVKQFNACQSLYDKSASIERVDIRSIRDIQVYDFIEMLLSNIIDANLIPQFIEKCIVLS